MKEGVTGFPSSAAGISVCQPFRFCPLKSDIFEGVVDGVVDGVIDDTVAETVEEAVDSLEGRESQARGKVMKGMIHNRFRGVFLMFISVG